jgi:hypothetical protein
MSIWEILGVGSINMVYLDLYNDTGWYYRDKKDLIFLIYIQLLSMNFLAAVTYTVLENALFYGRVFFSLSPKCWSHLLGGKSCLCSETKNMDCASDVQAICWVF